MSTKTKFNLNYTVIICFILTPFLTLRSQPLLPSPLKLQKFTTRNESLMNVCCVCVCRFGVIFTYVIEGIDPKVISVCLIKDYSLIADLHIFVYGRRTRKMRVHLIQMYKRETFYTK